MQDQALILYEHWRIRCNEDKTRTGNSWNNHKFTKKNLKKKTQNSTKHITTQGPQMGSMFKRLTHENEIHTHGRTMGHENTAMEKKKIEWKTNQGEAYTWSNRLLIPLDVIPCWGSH